MITPTEIADSDDGTADDTGGQQLKSKDASPNPSLFEMPAVVKSSATDPVSELMRLSEMTLVPFKIWLSATEAWQLGWAETVQGSKAGTGAPSRTEAMPAVI